MLAKSINRIKMADKKLNIRVSTKGAKKASKDLKGVDSRLMSLGKSAAITAGSFYALKKAWDFAVELKNFARDAEETTNKFKTVFSSMGDVATRTAKTLADSYGMAHTTAMELLGDTGDILVGFGFTEESALELSKKVQELSVDLASFTNYAGGASGASQALTKAILGETESAKALGIVLRQGTKEFKDSVAALQEVEGMTYNQAMATTLLNDAYEQSGKAIGDFSRTSDDLANRERILGERTKELREELGKALLPLFHDLTSAALGLVEAIDINKIKGYATAIGLVATGLIAARVATIGLAKSLRILRLAAVKTGIGALVIGIGELAAAFYDELDPAVDDSMKGLDDLNTSLLTVAKSTEQLRLEELYSDFIKYARNLNWAKSKGQIQSIASTLGIQYENVAMKDLLKTIGLTLRERIDGLEVTRSEKEGIIRLTASYQSWLATQQEGLDKKVQEQQFISRLIEENYALAKAMGFVEDATKLSLEQIASIQSEFNEQYREMTKSSFELQYLELENSVERFRTAKIEEVEIAQYVAERKKQIAADEAHFQQKTVGSLVGALGQLNQASKGNAKLSKGLAITSALIDTYAAANKALSASPPPWNFIAAAAVTAAGLANVIQIKSQKFHSGGLVGGQGDTPIMAQSGEFVLSRSAVQDIGVDTAQRINQGGGAGITVNIHGGIVQDDYIRNELLPAISRAEEMGA